MESLFYACPNLDTFQLLKFASDETNTEYFTYEGTTVIFGTPDIKWNQICFVFDNDSPLIYAKGKIFYNFNDLKELIESKIGDLGNKIESQEAIYYTQEEADAYNEENELQSSDSSYITTQTIKIPAVNAVPYTNVMEVILDNEEVIANALNTLNDQLSYINTNKVDFSNVYTKTEIDDKIANIDLSLYATTSEVNNKIGYLGNKVEAQEAIYYTQEEADAYNTKYNLDSGDSTYVTTESIINPAIEAVPYSNIMDVINDHKLMMVLNLSELSANKEDKINKTINISYNSTDDQYPSAKAVYTYVGYVIANIPIGNNTNKEDISNKVTYIDANNTYTQYPSAKAVYTYVGNAGFLTEHQDISGKESTSNKVTTITSESTNTQYPSAAAVYAYVGTAMANVPIIWIGTQLQYDAITTKDSSTIYIIQ